MTRRLKRLAQAGAVLAVLLVFVAAVPVVAIETGCRAGAGPASAGEPLPIADAGYRRAEGDSYLTYPEWYIVHAYADLAAVARQSSESGYDYAQAIGTYWTSLCGASARAAGTGTRDQRITDYIIGLSFTLEMAIQGAYERTVGATTAWIRGSEATPEDDFNRRFLDDYAAFLQQTPWYQYPFRAELVRFWRETPWSARSPVRSAERRASLSLEYGLKAIYAVGIGALAGASPADLTLMTAVKGPRAAEIPGVTSLRDLGGGLTLVQTPRYAAYTEILRAWAANGTQVVEIAGNRHILATVVMPESAALAVPGTEPIFTIPIQSRPGWHRIGLDAGVSSLAGLIDGAARQGGHFEHAYDY